MKNHEHIVYIKGMTCNSCKEKIENEISKNNNVNSVNIDLKQRKAIIIHNGHFTKGEAKKIIEDLGYKVSDNALKQGLLYGLIPHIGCIGFIIAAIIGATALTQFFRPLLMSRYFFHILIFVSILFATVSAIIYLNRNGSLNFQGIKNSKKYLATMYASTIAINLLLFLFIFPLATNLTYASVDTENLVEMNIAVNIPCSGHAPLITNELISLDGVESVRYNFPFGFRIFYDDEKISQDEILGIEVFEEYPARLMFVTD